MKRWIHYGLLILAAIFFLGGIITILIGYLRYLDAYETYSLEICQIVNRSTFIDHDVIQVKKFNFSKWFSVSLKYRNMILIPCFILSSVVNQSTIVEDIEIEAYTDLLSLIIALSLLTVCLVIMIIFVVIRVIEKKKHDYLNADVEVPSDFRYQDSILFPHEVVEDENLEIILQNFEEAQHQLWKNQFRLRENIFDTLRKEQIDALMGSQNVRIKFQKDVYAALKSLRKSNYI